MSNQTSLMELQPAIFTKLTADSALMAIITGVFDFGAVPVNQAFPYVTLGDDTEAPMNAFGTRGYEATVTLHIWDNTPNFKRCKIILAHMNRLLDQQTLTLATQHHVGTWYDFSTTMNDPGLDNIRHMPVRYRVETQEQ